jgi:hypothetical protein
MAGRSVGNIEITVDADTGQLTAQMTRGGRSAGRAGAREIDRALKDIGGASLTQALAKIRRQVETMLSGIDAEVGVAVAKADYQAARRQLENLGVGIDTEVGVDLKASDMAKARAQLASLGSGGGGAGGAGQAAGAQFGDGFHRGLSTRMKLIIGAIALLAEPAVVGFQALLGPAVEIVSSAFSGLAGAIGGAAPIMAGIVATGLSSIVAFQGMGDALGSITEEFASAAAEGRAFNIRADDIQDKLRLLTPNARAFANAFADIYPQLQKVQRAVAQQVFAGLDDQLRSMSTTAIPNMGRAFELAGISANRFFKELAGAARDIDFAGTFESIQPAIDAVGRGVANLLRAMFSFFRAASPAAIELGNSFERATDSLRNMIDAGSRSGALQRFLVEGVESLRDWWALTRNLGDALFTLFEAGKSGGDGMVRSLANLIERWDHWMEGVGRNDLQEFFQSARDSFEALGDVVQGLGGMFDNMITPGALARFQHLAEALGRALPFLGQLLELLGRLNILTAFVELIANIGDALQPVMPAIQGLADAIGGALLGAVSGVGPLLSGLAVVIGGLASVMTPFAPAILGVVAAIKLIGPAVGIARAAVSVLGLSLAATNPIALGLVVAVGAAVTAMSILGGSKQEVAARTRELSTALDNEMDSLLETVSAAEAAALGFEALSNTLANTGEDGAKLTRSLGTLGFTAKDATDVLLSFSGGSDQVTEALTALGEKAGLSGEGLARLVEHVQSSEEPFWGVSEANKAMAAALGISTEEMSRIGKAMEEVQDQAQKTDLQTLAQDFIDTSSAASVANQRLREQAEAMALLDDGVTSSLEVYENYTTLLGRSSAEQNRAEAATAGLTDAQLAQMSAIDALVAGQGSAQRSIGMTTSEIERMTKAVTGLSTSQQSMAWDVGGLHQLAVDAREAATAADELRQAWDLLSGGAQGLESATNNISTGILGLRDRIEEAKAGTEGYSLSLDQASEAGIANREAILGAVQGVQEWAAAALNSGMATSDVAAATGLYRQQLIDTAGQFGMTAGEAAAYVDQLGLTPAMIETLITTPGMVESILGMENLGATAETVPDATVGVTTPGLPEAQAGIGGLAGAAATVPAVDVPVTTPGLPTAMDMMAGFAALGGNVGDVVSTVTTPGLEPAITGTGELADNTGQIASDVSTAYNMNGLAPAVDDTSALVGEQEAVPGSVNTTYATPGLSVAMGQTRTYTSLIGAVPASDSTLFTQPGLVPGITNVRSYTSLINAVPGSDSTLFTQPGLVPGITNVRTLTSVINAVPSSKSTSFSMPGLSGAIGDVRSLAGAIAGVPSGKSVTFTINTVGSIPDLAAGGLAPALGAFGGERGLERAFYPDGSSAMLTSRTYVPSGTLVVPTERLRSDSGNTGQVIQRQVNAEVHVTAAAADPEAVAVQTVNRIAAAVNL